MGFNDGFSIQGVPFVTGSAGQVLTWDGTKWVAADPTGGGGGGPSTVYTSGNISGDGSIGNKIVLNADISLTSVTASFKGDISGTASYATDANTLDGLESTVFSTTGSNTFNGDQIINGYISASNGLTGSFSGSFIGDGSGLVNVPVGIQTIEFDRVIYVNSGSTGISGSFDDPFGTVQEAINYINTKYTSNESVLINIGPGSYNSPATITRRNLYFKAPSSKFEQKAVTFTGTVEISCSYLANRMFSDILGFEGIFFNGGGISNPTFKVSTNSYTTYLKDCYLAASSGGNALLLTSDLTTTFGNGARISAKDCYFWRASGNADLIVVNGGSCKFDTIEMGYGGAASAGTAIKQTGDSTIQIDRLLVDVATNVAAISSSATLGASPRLFISNSSLLSSGSANAIINNTNLFIVNSYLGNNISQNPTIAGSGIVSYGSLTAIGQLPIVINGILKYPLAETFGNASFGSLSASSGITGSFNGNGAALTGILTSSITNFTNSVRSLFSGSGIISYNSSNGEISAPSAMTGVLTSGNITGSGVSGNPVTIIDNPTFTTISASSNMYVGGNLYVVGTASVGLLETVSQSSLQIGDKYITVLTGADNHGAANGSGILWGSGSSPPTVGPEGSVAYTLYVTGAQGEYIEVFPGLRVSGSLTASNGISSSAGFYGDGSGLTGVTASTLANINEYAKSVDVSSSFARLNADNLFTGSNVFSGSQTTITGALVVSTSISSSQLTGTLFGTASNADRLGGFLAVEYAKTGSANTFNGNQTITGSLLISSNISSSDGITGSFSGNGRNLTNLTGSSWSSTSAFFADVRDTFIFDTNSFITGSVVGGRYPISASAGGGSAAGAQLTYVQTITGSSPLPTLTSGMIVGVSGANIVRADNSNLLSSNIVGVVSGTSAGNIIISIAGEVSASKSGSTSIDGGTPVYLSDDPGKYTIYDNVGSGKYIVQIGILGPLDNKVILQPRIFGIKA